MRTIFVASIVALLLCASGAVLGQKTPGYQDKESGFEFTPPAGWTRKADMPKPLVAYVGKPDQDYAPNFSANVFARRVPKKSETLFLDDVRKEYKKIGTMSAIKKTTLAGKPAYTWSARVSVPNYPTVVNRQIVCFYKERAYELTFTALPATMKKYEKVFAQIVASFRFIPSKPEK